MMVRFLTGAVLGAMIGFVLWLVDDIRSSLKEIELEKKRRLFWKEHESESSR